MMTHQDTLHIKVELHGSLILEFEHIKKKLGIKNNTDVIRYLIREKFEKTSDLTEQEVTC